MRTNQYGQPIGDVVTWTPPPHPPHEPLHGRFCRVEPLRVAQHADDLHAANSTGDGRNWTYLFGEPHASLESYRTYLHDTFENKRDPQAYAIVDLPTGRAVGLATYLRIAPAAGSIEVGHLNFSPLLQRQPAATEALYLLMRNAFGLGYRRYEWKCDALNAPSRRAAQRLGLSYEGIFRQALVYKGRNRDTAWFAAIDSEWPALDAAYQHWLDPANFDADGQQRVRLSALTAPVLKAKDQHADG